MILGISFKISLKYFSEVPDTKLLSAFTTSEFQIVGTREPVHEADFIVDMHVCIFEY